MASSKAARAVLYRVSQFFAALGARLPSWTGGARDGLTAEDEALVTTILAAAPQQQLFTRMPPNDRRHALAVARTLGQAGHHHPALMQAALLHDVGKSVGQPIIHRVLIVLFEAFWPAALRRLANPGEMEHGPAADGRIYAEEAAIYQVSWWRRPFVIHARHAAIGAAWAAQAACQPLAVELIARHQDVVNPEADCMAEKLLAVLQWADNLN